MTIQRHIEENLSRGLEPLEGQLTAALEAVPHVAVPKDFAARVMSRVPKHKVLSYQRPVRASIGRRVSMLAAVILLMTVLAFAEQTTEGSATTRIIAESIFALEFASLTVWLSLRPRESQ